MLKLYVCEFTHFCSLINFIKMLDLKQLKKLKLIQIFEPFFKEPWITFSSVFTLKQISYHTSIKIKTFSYNRSEFSYILD